MREINGKNQKFILMKTYKILNLEKNLSFEGAELIVH